MNSKQPLLLLLMEPVGDLLGDQGGVAAGAVVDDEVKLNLMRLAPCAMRFLLSCPIHPAYRSLAVPIKVLEWRPRKRKLFSPPSRKFAMVIRFLQNCKRKEHPPFPPYEYFITSASHLIPSLDILCETVESWGKNTK